jgi:hypothetical protein
MRAFFAALHEKPVVELTEPTDWGFTYPAEIVREGFVRYLRSDFQKMPDPNDIMNSDPAWWEDMRVAYRIYKRLDPDNWKATQE